jgi:WD40 repeat protein
MAIIVFVKLFLVEFSKAVIVTKRGRMKILKLSLFLMMCVEVLYAAESVEAAAKPFKARPAKEVAENRLTDLLAGANVEGGDRSVVDLISKYAYGSAVAFDEIAINEGIGCIACSPDGKLLGVGTDAGVVKILNLVNLQFLGELLSEKNEISAICFSPDGDYLAAGFQNGTIVLWRTHKVFDQWDLIYQFNIGNTALRLSKKDVELEQEEDVEKSKNGLSALAFSLDNKFLASGFKNGSIFVIDLSNLIELSVNIKDININTLQCKNIVP